MLCCCIVTIGMYPPNTHTHTHAHTSNPNPNSHTHTGGGSPPEEVELYTDPSFIFLQLYHCCVLGEDTPTQLPSGEVSSLVGAVSHVGEAGKRVPPHRTWSEH